MPVPASCAPRPNAVFASCDSAPNDMSETNNGISSQSGLAAFGPMHTSLPTGTSSSNGNRASCAVTNWIESQLGSS